MAGSSGDLVPRWQDALAIIPIDARSVLLHGETGSRVLRGAVVAAVAPLIDGRRSVAQIGALLPGPLGPLALDYVLEALQRAGHLRDEAPPAATHSVALTVIGPVADVTVARALEAAGLRVVATACGLEIVACADLLDPRVAQHLRGRPPGQAVLLAQLGRARSLIGPLLDASAGPCLDCLSHALAWNRPLHRFVLHRLGRDLSPPTQPDATDAPTASALLAQVAQDAARGERGFRAAVLAFDAQTLETGRHTVRRRPQCPQCGDAGWMAAQGWRAPALQARAATERLDGGHRCCTPEETVARLLPLVSPITGAIEYLQPMPHRNTATRHVYVAAYPLCPQTWPADNGFDRVCAGKGRTAAQARAGALGEAIERASGVWQGDEAVLRGTRAALGQQAIAFDALQLFSARQFAEREAINAQTRDRRRQVPLPFDEHAEIAWTPAWPLDGGAHRLVPLAYCFAETPPEDGARFGLCNPNGSAAGNVLEEAILQGLLELIERDATAIWWYQRVRRPAVDLDAVDDLFVQTLRADHARSGWRVQVLDLSHDLGIPVCAAVGYHAALDRHAIGFGCHLQGTIALGRALTELNQLLDERPDAPAPWDRQLLGPTDFLAPHGVARALPQLSTSDQLLDDIVLCRQRLARAGLEVLIVDKTRPDMGLSAVQVIVPGLRHFWPRFGPGRLYTVPQALGWTHTLGDETGLNPAPLFL
jgi:bacteriocin biosynthesis cyclodehydratase domain-containing protein